MAIIPNKLLARKPGHSEFRNPLITFIDAKAIDIDKTMVSLFELLRHNGSRARVQREARIDYTVDHLIDTDFAQLERDGKLHGGLQHRNALKFWLRSNLVDFVYRGKGPALEKITSLRPIHIKSFVIRNAKHLRAYNSDQQVYSMLSVDNHVLNALRDFLQKGWNPSDPNAGADTTLDIDSLGILRLVEHMPDGVNYNEKEDQHIQIKPLLRKDAQRYCDDVHALLQYQAKVPRHVLLDYIRIITAFHLALYHIRLFQLLPRFVEAGRVDESLATPLVIDLTDNPESGAAQFAMSSLQQLTDSLMDYIRAVFKINAALRSLGYSDFRTLRNEHLDAALELLKNPTPKFMADCNAHLESYIVCEQSEDRVRLDEILQYEENDLERLAEGLVYLRGKFHFGYLIDLISGLSLKNTEAGLMAQGKSRRHKRRFVLGSKLLETLIQLCVLRHDDRQYYSEPVSIEDFIGWLEQRYGLIVNGIGNPSFPDDIAANLAFQQNVDALREKLRQIGYYNVLSDAYILQKIRPRYRLEPTLPPSPHKATAL